jgi:coenzyme PQQ biosynthesis protein PqqD
MSPSLDDVIQRRSDIRFRRVKDEWVVIRQTTAEVLVLNEWAGRVLELLDGTRTVRDIVESLSQEYDEDRARVEQDVMRFTSELIEAGLGEPVVGVSP